ncbi:4Fe-4S binding protein [Selenihalanaerobacter shriftii]|uniref:4Fe-4S binding domain-containing protein n=1 Tax=Selenihalanaerobacter shriftii TaxID=142842 RepID=A0A1T4K335_9FIRM|nr:4Fe-4S binding protein [Selenihalanaerobacter shriftii]SJZ36826.1 4Fe-4S binding domain-containing protein [Selenihalanaerobacter shriftii]
MTSTFWRRLSQIFFVSFLAVFGIKHQVIGGGPKGAPPLDSYCVFGGVETLYSWIHNGEFLLKTNMSNIILLFTVLVITIFMGAVFCGWICPLGAIQDFFNFINRKTINKKIYIPHKLELPFRSLKYILLILITFMTIRTGQLWFEGYDPLKVFFHFKFESLTPIIILIIFSILGVLIERFWCKYLCPLGAIIFPLSYLSIINLNKNHDQCNDCNICDSSCSMDLQPSRSTSKTECIKCLDCMKSCNQSDVLYLTLGKKGR